MPQTDSLRSETCELWPTPPLKHFGFSEDVLPGPQTDAAQRLHALAPVLQQAKAGQANALVQFTVDLAEAAKASDGTPGEHFSGVLQRGQKQASKGLVVSCV